MNELNGSVLMIPNRNKVFPPLNISVFIRIISTARIMSEGQKLFPSMGEVASRTEALTDVDDDDARLRDGAPALIEQQEGEEREMQEIESLCMRCHDQVGW